MGAVTRPGRGTQADMIFMLGLQRGAGPKGGSWSWQNGREWEGDKPKPDCIQLRPHPGEGLPWDTEIQSRDKMGYFGAEFQERHFLHLRPAPGPILSSGHPAGAAGSSEHQPSLGGRRLRRRQEQRAPSQKENISGAGTAVHSRLFGRGLAWQDSEGSVTLSAPTGSGRTSPAGSLGSTPAACTRT